MNMGGNVVVLDGERSYMQSKETNEGARINYEQGQCVTYVWALVKTGSGEGDGEGAEGQSLLDLGHGERGSTGIHPACVRAVSPHEDDQQGDEGRGRKEEE